MRLGAAAGAAKAAAGAAKKAAAVATKAPNVQPAPIHAVTLIGSYISNNPSVRRTLQALGLKRRHQTVLHKNTPSVNGMLQTVKREIAVRPVKVRVVQATTFNALYRGPNDFFISSGHELIVKQGTPAEEQWANKAS